MGNILCCHRNQILADIDPETIGLPLDFILTKRIKEGIKRSKFTKKEVVKLWKIFKYIGHKIDNRGKETTENMCINQAQLAVHCNRDIDTFFANMFELWDIDGKDELKFGEFLIGLHNLLLRRRPDLYEYVFQVYNTTEDGYIQGYDLMAMLEEIHGANSLHPMSATTAMKLYDRKKDGKLDFLEFEESVRNFPMLMWRPYLWHDAIKKHILGCQFWDSIFRRLHPKLIHNHQELFKKELEKNWQTKTQSATNCYQSSQRCCNRFFSCCFSSTVTHENQNKNQDIENQNIENQANSTIDQESTDLQPKSNQTIKSRKSTKKSKAMFNRVQDVEKRLDLEILGEYDSSDSEIREYVEKQARTLI